MSRDSKRPTAITIQLDKTGKHILVTDLSGDAPTIIPKEDKDTLHETIVGIIENKDLQELSIANLTVTNTAASGSEGFNISDLGNLQNNPTGFIIGEAFKFLQKNSGKR